MGVVLQYDGFVYGFSLQICGQPFLSCIVVGIHQYLCSVQLCLKFSLAQIKPKFILSTDNKAKKGGQYLGEQSMNSYVCFKAESWQKDVDQIQQGKIQSATLRGDSL